MKRFYEFQLDPVNECLWREGTRLTLTPKAFKILNCLVENVGRTVTKDEFMEEVWPGIYVGEENLKVYIRELRALLSDQAGKPRFIETYRDKGYRFIASVIEETDDRAEGDQLFGRETELAKLNSSFEQARDGNRQIVFVTGEPGIGKTALVEAFLLQLSGRVIRVGLGQCIESYREQEAFYPVLEAFGRLLNDATNQEFGELLARHAPTWLVQFSGIVSLDRIEALRGQVIGAGRERMLREICKALEIVTAETPLVICIEDLHWTDHSTLDLIAALARRREPARLLLLATYRPVEVILAKHPLRQLKSELCLHHQATEVPLELLNETAVSHYLTAHHSKQIAEQLAASVWQKTDGNPLFIVALMNHLVNQQMIVEREGEWKLQCSAEQVQAIVPDSLLEIIKKQVEQLSPREQEVLTAASVIGQSFSTAVLAKSLQSTPSEIDECCDSLSRSHLLLTRGGLLDLPNGEVSGLFNFTHALHRDAIYRDCSPSGRLNLHRRVGEALEDTWREQKHEIAGELVRHFQECRDYFRVANYLQLQANNAEHRYAYQDAITLLNSALQVTLELKNGSVALNCEIKTQLARIYDRLGDKSKSAELYQEVTALASAANLNDVAAASMLGLSREIAFTDSEKALDLADRSLVLFTDDNSAPRLAAEAWSIFLRLGSKGFDAALQSELKERFDLLRELGDERTLAEHAFGLAVVQMFTGNHEGALQTAAESLPMLARSGDSLAHFTVHWMQNWALLRLGRVGEALKGLRDAVSLVRKNMSAFDTAIGQLVLAELHCEAFDPPGAVSLCEEALPIIRRSESAFIMQRALTFSGIAHMLNGSLTRAEEHLSEMHRLHDTVRIPFAWYWKLPLYCASIELALLQDDLAAAKINLERLRSLAAFHPNLRYRVRLKQLGASCSLAEGDVESAEIGIGEALALVTDHTLPLVAWRVHQTAMDLHQQTGDVVLLKHHRELRDNILMELADSIPESEPLHWSIMRNTLSDTSALAQAERVS